MRLIFINKINEINFISNKIEKKNNYLFLILIKSYLKRLINIDISYHYWIITDY